MLFVGENANNIHYFRAPVDLSISNSRDMTDWELNEDLSDEFDLYDGFQDSKWNKDYGWQNHPSPKNAPSMYYNNPGTGNHIFNYTPSYDEVMALRTHQAPTGSPFIFDDPYTNQDEYDYRSAVAISESTQYEGYFEIRSKMTKTQWEKFCFWLQAGKSDIAHAFEIDVFEIEGGGKTMPTNYHEYLDLDDVGETDSIISSRFDIYPLHDQNFSDDFYTFAVEWNSDEIMWYLNNQLVRTVSKDQNYPEYHIADNKLYVFITTRLWTEGEGYFEEYADNDFEIDYVRVYTKKGATKSALVSDDEEINLTSEFNIYPNPSSNFINISLPKNLTYTQLTITSLEGKLIRRELIQGSAIQYDISSIDAGVYIFSIISDNVVFNRLQVIN